MIPFLVAAAAFAARSFFMSSELLPAHSSSTRVTKLTLTLMLLTLGCTGCSSLPSGRNWGEAATVTPGWARVGSAVGEAARDPWVWAPLIGAAVFQIDDWDRRTSDWARERTPIFGSQREAEEWSDDLKDASAIVHYASIALMPSGDTFKEAAWNKAKGALVQVAAVSLTANLTSQSKDWFDRTRPNGAAKESFPSGHTSSSAVHTRLTSRNVHALGLSSTTTRALDVGLYALTIGTSWSRIEAGWHYPSDTLVGMALGNFIASFINDAFLGTQGTHAQIGLSATDGGAMFVFRSAIR